MCLVKVYGPFPFLETLRDFRGLPVTPKVLSAAPTRMTRITLSSWMK
jgi:hypothetical protein